MISRISEYTIWNQFKRASPSNARKAIKFAIDKTQLLVYTLDSVVVFDYTLDRTIGVTSWYRNYQEFEDEYSYRKFVADALRSVLICRGITQDTIARRLGISRTRLNKYLNCVYPIPSFLLYKMCQEAEILFSDLMAE